MKLSNIGLVSVLCCLASVCIANTVTLKNGGKLPLHIVYQKAYMNKGQKPIFGKRTTLTLHDQERIEIPAKGYQYVGIVPVLINGHDPHGNNKFAKAQQCSVATDAKHSDASMVITFHQYPNGHGDIMCRPINGVLS